MLRVNDRGVTERVKSPTLVEMDCRAEDCRIRLKYAIKRAQKEVSK